MVQHLIFLYDPAQDVRHTCRTDPSKDEFKYTNCSADIKFLGGNPMQLTKKYNIKRLKENTNRVRHCPELHIIAN